MHSVLNTLSEYSYFYISKNITSYTFVLLFKIFECLQSVLNHNQKKLKKGKLKTKTLSNITILDEQEHSAQTADRTDLVQV